MKTILQTPTNKLQNSLDFYSKLNFKIISEKDPILVSDGKAVIEINPDRFARAGLKLFNTSWKNTIKEIEEIIPFIQIDNGYLLNDPSGIWIYLIEKKSFEFNLPQIPQSFLGNFAGISLETISIEKSMKIWQTLGFTKNMGEIDQGWVSLINKDEVNVSLIKALSCPHLFFNPSLTYFNGKNNLAVIEKIRKLKIPITEEITYFNKQDLVDNLIIRDPGGLGFFIFSD